MHLVGFCCMSLYMILSPLKRKECEHGIIKINMESLEGTLFKIQ